MPRTTLHAFVKRGKNVGEFLYPHRHVDGKYVVSATRFKRDYIRLESVEDVLAWLEKGYSVRMSNPAKGITAASLIGPESIFKTTTS